MIAGFAPGRIVARPESVSTPRPRARVKVAAGPTRAGKISYSSESTGPG